MGTAQEKPITLLLADPNVLFRSALARLLDSLWDMEVVAETGDGLKVADLATEFKPEVILSEIMLEGCPGPALAGLLKERYPGIHLVFLTTNTDPDVLLSCVFAGASGVLYKDVTPGELYMRIRGLRKGEAAIALTTVTTLIQRLNKHNTAFTLHTTSASPLTQRESEIVALVSRGLTNKAIGRQLNLSEYTVRNHLTTICQKLEVHNRLQVAVYGVTHGLVDIYVV
ncbi:MAG: response regulator transcription factor [Chloroflexota bacterium]|jgi:DNA-binding NarL/FixJ family response regulator|nr:response regulator transcription factor [Anaerolineae bacterium]